ncbi:MAG: hypothetical protein RLN72_04420 [Henriciella sp.]
MKKRIATLFAALAMGTTVTACSTLGLGCDDYFSYDEIMESWIGGDLIDYERRNNVRPISTLKRPQNRTEYSYRTHDEWIDGYHYECVTRMTADDTTGKITDWGYEGNYCLGYCRD